MKNVLPIAGIALALTLSSATAYAADQRGDHRGQRDAVAHQNDDNKGHGNWQGDGTPPRGPVTVRQQPNWQPGNNNGGNWQNNNRGRGNQAFNGGFNNNRFDNNRFNNGHSNFDRFRNNFQAQQRFRVGAYRAPRDYNYRRWSFGQRLPFEYFSRGQWLTNALIYGLFAPPPGLIWVRYGPDALLVDQYTGEIVQVRYGVFY